MINNFQLVLSGRIMFNRLAEMVSEYPPEERDGAGVRSLIGLKTQFDGRDTAQAYNSRQTVPFAARTRNR
jgi:hypothetical protein